MTVVSNTSPLNYLVLIDLQYVLPALFERVLIPEAVLRELRSSGAPQQVKNWLGARIGSTGKPFRMFPPIFDSSTRVSARPSFWQSQWARASSCSTSEKPAR